MLLSGQLANTLHTVPALLWHLSPVLLRRESVSLAVVFLLSYYSVPVQPQTIGIMADPISPSESDLTPVLSTPRSEWSIFGPSG
jgi:hypothetical protein